MGYRDRLLAIGRYISRRMPTGLIRPFTLPFIYQVRVSDGLVFENANMVNLAFSYCANNKIEGDFAEFGVLRGQTTIEAWRAAHRHGLKSMRFWLFDSFLGLPEVKGIDDGGPFETGEFSFDRSGYELNLRRENIDFQRIQIEEGFFEDTLPVTNTNRKFSVVWIDCDLYESTVPVLEWLTDKLVDGAIICFDDWYTFNGKPDKGEQLACSEWLSANPNLSLMPYREFHWAGKSFIVHIS